MVTDVDRDAARHDRNHGTGDPEDDHFELAGRRHSPVLGEASLKQRNPPSFVQEMTVAGANPDERRGLGRADPNWSCVTKSLVGVRPESSCWGQLLPPALTNRRLRAIASVVLSRRRPSGITHFAPE
jgi:hypothetical protein